MRACRLPAFVAAQKDAAEILEAALAPLVPAAGAITRLKGGCGGAHAPRSPRKKEAKEPTRSRPVLAPACGGARALAPAAYKDAATEAWNEEVEEPARPRPARKEDAAEQ